MDEGYSVKLVARNEGLEYRDKSDVYRFNVKLTGGRWVVSLPGSKGAHFMTHELSDDERRTILPRISKYLEGKRYFGFVGPRYPVSFETEDAVSPAVANGRRRAAEWWNRRSVDKDTQ